MQIRLTVFDLEVLGVSLTFPELFIESKDDDVEGSDSELADDDPDDVGVEKENSECPEDDDPDKVVAGVLKSSIEK